MGQGDLACDDDPGWGATGHHAVARTRIHPYAGVNVMEFAGDEEGDSILEKGAELCLKLDSLVRRRRRRRSRRVQPPSRTLPRRTMRRAAAACAHPPPTFH